MKFTCIECMCMIQTTSLVCSIFYKIKSMKNDYDQTNRISPGGWKPVGTMPLVVIINWPCWVCKFSLKKIETYKKLNSNLLLKMNRFYSNMTILKKEKNSIANK
jgi:hypothetical protein